MVKNMKKIIKYILISLVIIFLLGVLNYDNDSDKKSIEVDETTTEETQTVTEETPIEEEKEEVTTEEKSEPTVVEETENNNEEERTFRGVVYEKGYGIRKERYSSGRKRISVQYYLFDEDTKTYVVYYSSNDWCALYKDEYSGKLSEGNDINLQGDVVGYSVFEYKKENEMEISKVIAYIKGCKDDKNNHQFVPAED